MKINFPQDRSLHSKDSERCETNITLQYDEDFAVDTDANLNLIKKIGFSIITIFSRIYQVDKLCVRIDKNAIPTALNGIDFEWGPHTPLHDFYIYGSIVDEEFVSASFANTEISANATPDSTEINLCIFHASNSSRSVEENFDGGMIIYDILDGFLNLKIIYKNNVISPITAVDFLEKIGRIINQISEKIDTKNYLLSTITNQSKRIIPNPLNAIEKKIYPSLPIKFFEVSEKFSSEIAIAGNDLIYSYGFLRNRTISIANRLADAGVCVGDVVAIQGASSPGTIASILAVMAVGGVVVIIDNLLPDERRKLISDISKPKFIIEVGQIDSSAVISATTISTQDWPNPDLSDSETLTALLPSANEYQSAYIFFTSGSSGIPKGVLGSHLGLAHFLDWQRSNFPIGPGDRTAQLTALSFDVVLRDLFYPLTSGACIHIPKREVLLDSRKILSWMKVQKISVMHCVPSLMRAWLLADIESRPFGTLKYIFFAGEPLTDSLLHRFRLAASESTQIVNLYGPTETTLAKLSNRIEEIETGIQPVGKPQPGVDVLIMKDRRTVCGLWETGEITIRTPYRSFGYFENENLTREVFQINPMRSDDTDFLYFTGDLGRYRSDGKVEIFGRIDSQIKIRGVRIEPNEIESCILRFPKIMDAAITTRNTASGDKILLAVVVSQSSGNFDEAVQAKLLREFLKGKLHDAMVPSRIIFTEALPYLPNGKLDRKSISNQKYDVLNFEKSTALDHLTLDSKLVKIISEIENVLGIQINDLNNSFVDLGGDSLSYIRISFAIEDQFGELPPDWELIPLNKLGSFGNDVSTVNPGKTENSFKSLVTIELPVLLRAFAIFFVVLGHASKFQFIGTSTLFVISGMSFGKFFRRGLYEKSDIIPVIKFILKFGIPAGLWELLAIITRSHDFWLPDLFLMGSYFHDPRNSHFTLWYLDVLTANILIISFLTIFLGKLSRHFIFKKSQFSIDFLFVVLGLLVAFVQVGTGWMNGVVGESSVAPFKWFWMLALGATISQLTSTRERMLVTFLLSAIWLAKMGSIYIISASFDMLDSFFFISTIALVWLNRLKVPLIFRRPIVTIASASLFIYIVNYSAIKITSRILDFEESWPIQVLMAMIFGILASWIWNKIEVYARFPADRFKKFFITYG